MIKCFTDICVNSKNAFFGASDGLCFLLPSCRTRSRCARHAVQTSNSIEGSGQTIRGFFKESVICPLRSSHQTDTQHRFFNGEVQLIFGGFFYRKLLIKKVKFIFLLSHKDKFYLKLLTS